MPQLFPSATQKHNHFLLWSLCSLQHQCQMEDTIPCLFFSSTSQLHTNGRLCTLLLPGPVIRNCSVLMVGKLSVAWFVSTSSNWEASTCKWVLTSHTVLFALRLHCIALLIERNVALVYITMLCFWRINLRSISCMIVTSCFCVVAVVFVICSVFYIYAIYYSELLFMMCPRMWCEYDGTLIKLWADRSSKDFGYSWCPLSSFSGMLVVNVTWRNKTYVGTLLDCTRHDWAPPRYTVHTHTFRQHLNRLLKADIYW